jgi:hypothetical protein
MQELYKSSNFLNIKPSLYLNNSKRFLSKIGTFIGILAIIISLIFTVLIFDDYIKEENPNIFENKIINFKEKNKNFKNSNYLNSLKINKFPFMFKLIYNNMQNISIEDFNFQINFLFLENKKNFKENLTYKKCDKKYFENFYNNNTNTNSNNKDNFIDNDININKLSINIDDYNDIDLNDYYCIDKNINDKFNNFTINAFNPLDNNSNYIEIKILEVKNKNNNNNNFKINNSDNDIRFIFAALDYEIDHKKNYQNIIKPFLRFEIIDLDYNSNTNIKYFLQKNIYNSHIGIFITSTFTEIFYKFKSIIYTTKKRDIISNDNKIDNNNNYNHIESQIATFSIYVNPEIKEYNRSYRKFHEFFGNLIGFIYFIMIFFKLVILLFSSEELIIHYMNSIIKPNIDYDNNDIKNSDKIISNFNKEMNKIKIKNKLNEINNYNNTEFNYINDVKVKNNNKSLFNNDNNNNKNSNNNINNNNNNNNNENSNSNNNNLKNSNKMVTHNLINSSNYSNCNKGNLK